MKNKIIWSWLWSAFGLLFCVALYGRGSRIMETSENYFFTCGGLALTIFLANLTYALRPWLKGHFKVITELVYGQIGGVYFAWALIGLVLVAVAPIFNHRFDFLADRLADATFYCLIAGVAKKAWA